MGSRAKLFMHGRSQAVRLPEEFRFRGSEVWVTRVGNRVILEPVGPGPVPWDAIDALGARDFMAARREQPSAPPDRVVFDN